MPARVAAPPSTRAATRTTRRTAAVPPSAEDDLAATLDRVLQVSEPEPQPKKRVTSASKASATKTKVAAKTPSSAVAKTATKTAKASVQETETTTTKPAVTRTRRTAPTTSSSSSRSVSAATSRSTRAPTSTSIRTTASTATASKEPPPATADDDDLPWTKPGVGVRERAQSAQVASNSSIKLLSEAQAAGYRKGTKSEWTPKVAKAVREGRAGVKVLRELYGSGSQRLAVERGAFNLAFKCIALDMNTTALELLGELRHSLVKDYEHVFVGDEWTWDGITTYPRAKGEVGDVLRVLLCNSTIAAWCSLLPNMDPEAIPSTLTISDAPNHPLILAPLLPLTSIGPFAVLLYRRISAVDVPISASWLRLRFYTAFATTVSSSAADDPPKKNSPDSIWSHVARTCQKYLAGTNDKRAVATFISQCVDVVERTCAARGESRNAWFGGSWSTVADIWVGIGRSLGDSAVIDEALAVVTSIATISGDKTSSSASVRSGTTTPLSTSASSAVFASSASSVSKISNASAIASQLSAKLAKIQVQVEALAADPTASGTALADVLAGVDLDTLLSALCSMGSEGASVTSACLRGLERLRRVLVKLLDRPKLADVVRKWLSAEVTLIENLLGEVNDDRLPAISRDCLPGLVDSTLKIAPSLGTTELTSLLDRVYALVIANTTNLSAGALVQFVVCLSQTAHATAVRLTHAKANGALGLIKRSVDWSSELLASPPDDENVLESTHWKAIHGSMMRRLELLAFCYQEKDKPAAMAAFARALLTLDDTTIHRIEKESASMSPYKIFANVSDWISLLKRCTTFITNDPETVGFASVLWSAMDKAHVSTAVRGAIGERVMGALEHARFKPHVQVLITELADRLLVTYADADYPMRRMRVILRLMATIAATGYQSDRFNPLSEEIEHLASQTAFGNDSGLEKYSSEYHACALVLRALDAYHATHHSVAAVAQLGGAALKAIRNLIAPPQVADKPAVAGKRVVSGTRGTRATVRSTRTTASKTASKPPATKPSKAGAVKVAPKTTEPTPLVIDDMERFCELLDSLATLFGVMGLVLPKLETLRALRTVQRQDQGEAYVITSARLGTEYGRLGKFSRAQSVFAAAVNCAEAAENSSQEEGLPAVQAVTVSPAALLEVYLRYARYLAISGQVAEARDAYANAQDLFPTIPEPTNTGTFSKRWIELCAVSERVALAHGSLSAIRMAEGDVASALNSLTIAYRQWCRGAHGIAHLAAEAPDAADVQELEAVEEEMDEHEKAKAKSESVAKAARNFCFTGKYLTALQWHYAEHLVDATFDLTMALARRGSVKECEYYLVQVRGMVPAIRSSSLSARVSAHSAELESRRLHFDTAAEQITSGAEFAIEGPDAVELMRVQGELLSRQQENAEADEMFIRAVNDIVGLDGQFTTSESWPSPVKEAGVEPLFPNALGHLLRRRAWLLKEAGCNDEYSEVVGQLQHVPEDKSENLFLDAKVSMHDAFDCFKTDLFMSSLTESTIAMTMSGSERKDRASSRHTAQLLLEKASEAFRSTLAAVARTGKVEEVRQACVSLAVLGAFQTSLGHGNPETTASAAGVLASASSITLHRELLSAVDGKFADPNADDFDWPALDIPEVEPQTELEEYWKSLRQQYQANDYLQTDYDLSSLPKTWTVVSITVTDDRNTMLVSRHQNGSEPLVFCIPLDRQGRREGEDESELFTFDAGMTELKAVMDGNEASISAIKKCMTQEDKKTWWRERIAIDTRLGELLATIEFCWLGAFKTVLNPRSSYDTQAFATFKERLDRIFQSAVSGGSERRSTRVQLPDVLLQCFATLSSKCKDEEVEDLVYFILDQYQFNGVPVALAELDFDQLGVDVKSALSDLEAASLFHQPQREEEHLLLALDKNVQGIPWESIPILRGRAVSRIPSLPFLLHTPRREISRRSAEYYLNPSGDLTGTQSRFEPRIASLEKKYGWTGLTGSKPTEAVVLKALEEKDLVVYCGHGGGEEYVRGHKIRHLQKCAVTMLWGCSSGLLRDQGDLDRTGTPMDYVLAGCPCLVGNLWDVTDKDIDRLTEVVLDQLGLGETEAKEEKSVVQAVSGARTSTKLQFLTGAAPVVYGIPVYFTD